MRPFSPDLLRVLAHYRRGDFPMADARDAHDFAWFNPPLRGIIPIDRLIVGDALKKAVLDGDYEVHIDSAFDAVIESCARAVAGREETWINRRIEVLFKALHRAGYAHSVECWRAGKLVGGLYGLAPGGGVFCGESMFSRAPRASAVALVHLCARLQAGGFTLLDCQIPTDHTVKFGAYEISQSDYLHRLQEALNREADFSLRTGHDNPVDERALVRDYLTHRS